MTKINLLGERTVELFL